jgi:hypothetical protein
VNRSLAFITGAVAAGVAFAALTALGLWVASLVLGHDGPIEAMAVAVPIVGTGAALLTYVDEVIVYRAEKRSDQSRGEPWAYRKKGVRD